VIGRGRVVGVDLGSRRIGVAVTDASQTVATGVTTVSRSGDRSSDHRALAAIVREYAAVGMVVGVPYSLSGGHGPAARAALREVEELRVNVDVEVETVDERLSTLTAASALRAAGRRERAQRAVIDQSAAAVLLQGWIDRRRSRTDGLSID
jgi:putative Holliday junction resolvase